MGVPCGDLQQLVSRWNETGWWLRQIRLEGDHALQYGLLSHQLVGQVEEIGAP
jgi:hypothetical protein